MCWKIDGGKIPSFVVEKGEDSSHQLKIPHHESGAPWNGQVTLEVLAAHPNVALITAVDRRGTTDGSPPYKSFLCYSFCKSKSKQIITSYLIYTFSGPVIVKAWDNEKKGLLENINMFHLDITPDRVPNKVIQKHLERINKLKCVGQGLKKRAEKTYFDMLWNVPEFYCLYEGNVSEF